MRNRLMPVMLAAFAVACAAPAAAAEIEIRMGGGQYAPAKVEAKVGDVLRFVNDDGADHAVFVPTKGHGLDLGAQKPGEARTYTVRKPGSFDVECVQHGHMAMSVNVTR